MDAEISMIRYRDYHDQQMRLQRDRQEQTRLTNHRQQFQELESQRIERARMMERQQGLQIDRYA